MSDAVAELRRLEEARCGAITAGDTDAVSALLAEELSHTHASGVTQDRPTYLAALEGKPRETRRTDDLDIRIYGDAAVMTGTLLNTFPPSEPGDSPRQVELHALQVWARRGDGWKLVAFASSGPRK